MKFLESHENTFTSRNNVIQLRGVGLGNWLNLEHFMFGLPGTDKQIRQAITETYGEEKANIFWNKYHSVYVNEKDIRYIHECGMNHVRIPINYQLFFTDSFEKSVAIREIDRILPYLKKYKIWGIIDLHTAPGGQNPDWHSDNYSGKDNFWLDDFAIKSVVELWGRIAEYYSNEPAIGGYDLINEPCYFSKEAEVSMIDFFKQCTSKIRKVDKKHIIIYSGNMYSRDFSMFAENIDDNSAYTFHLYPFLQIPNDLQSDNIALKLKESLNNDVSYRHLTTQLKKPLWCGETGHPLHMDNSYNVLHEFISILETENVSWALWPFKDRGEMGICYAKKDGEWNKLCRIISEDWIFWNLFTQDSMLSAQQEKDIYTYYRWLANESTKGWEVVRKKIKNIPFEALFKALDDFSFDNCKKNEKLLPKNYGNTNKDK